MQTHLRQRNLDSGAAAARGDELHRAPDVELTASCLGLLSSWLSPMKCGYSQSNQPAESIRLQHKLAQMGVVNRLW